MGSDLEGRKGLESEYFVTNIVSCKYEEDWMRGFKESTGNNHELDAKFMVQVNNPFMHGKEVLRQVRVLVAEDASPIDRVPLNLRVYFDHLGTADSRSFCDSVDCRLKDKEDPFTWLIVATYGPPIDAGPRLIHSFPLSDNPLEWPI